ncbi:flagellar hook protein FlgE [Butyrivibrio sp. YAB3001]|uniref:flagellar hook protein FlgE n=1 Tax=Butyrivibrio sp. YAB3001 TaxID=1520812 RepID=UPI0008F63327|nr:flagellar hook-basal body complex protein [Butyrivibrio sp. YAB3001]SFB66754.1 flagellar hook protein FlgE [Butyrivibrio sp. YAB3001]
MMRSLFSGVAGLKTHQTKMDVIGNNIANVNTTSFKSQSITFSDLMYQTTQAASAPTQTKGGVNARQIGLGSKSGAISTAIEGQGSTQTTNNPFDIMITGKAFFVVNNGQQDLYTRDGSFYVDGAGNLAMQSNGYLVRGWAAKLNPDTGAREIDTNSGLTTLEIMTADNSTYAPAATSQAIYSGNVDDNDTNINSDDGKTIQLEFYDNKGYLYTAKFSMKDVDKSKHIFNLQLVDILDSNGQSIGTTKMNCIGFGTTDYDSVNNKWNDDTALAAGYSKTVEDDGTITITDGTNSYNINSTGSVESITEVLKNAYGKTDAEIEEYGDYGTYSISGDGSIILKKGVNLRFDASTGNLVAADPQTDTETNKGMVDIIFNQTATIGGESVGLEAFGYQKGDKDTTEYKAGQLQIDFSSVTNYNSNGSATVKATKGDKKNNYTGRAVGEMNGITVSTDGKINATYSNGQTKLLGQIASAEFANASGLSKEGDNLYKQTLNSGTATIQDITTDGGYMNTGVLEMSNVDLSSEFTNMITTQRGFQANSRIITVSDTLLEELTNLKR